MLHSGNGAFYCAFVIVKLSGRFCVKPIYAHVSRFARDPLLLHVPAHVMLPRIIPHGIFCGCIRDVTKKKRRTTVLDIAEQFAWVSSARSHSHGDFFLRRIARIFVYHFIGLVICETNKMSSL